MSIVASRPEIRRPRTLRVDLRNTAPGLRLAEVLDDPDLISDRASAGGPPLAEQPKPTTEADRIAAWFGGEIRLAYPDTWAEIRPDPYLARSWVASGFDLAEMRSIVGPIIASGCPACELVGRIGDAMDERMRQRDRRRAAEEREEAEARARRDVEGERVLFRRLIAEAAGRFEQARATATRIERRELAEDEDGTWQALREVERQAWDSVRLAEKDLAARLEGALPWLAPGMTARDADGWPTPLGIVVDGVVYLLVGDTESADEGPGLIVRMPLDRIIGLG